MASVAKQSARGKFITFEGLDGCGKTTQLEKLAGCCARQGIAVVTTREPGGTEIGERIRAVLLDSRTAGLDAYAEMALMFASRAQQIAQVILPALEAGQWVLCDRFTDSTEAYQGGGRQLGSEAVLRLSRGAVPRALARPHDSDGHGRKRPAWPGRAGATRPPRGGRFGRRIRRRAAPSDENRFEKESHAFFTRVRNAYLEIATARAAARRGGGRAARRWRSCIPRLCAWCGSD